MHIGSIVVVLGALMMVTGLIAEGVAATGFVYYRVRRALPFSSPIDLQRLGGICFFAGVACAALGRWLTQ
jgi:hypothetical protein